MRRLFALLLVVAGLAAGEDPRTVQLAEAAIARADVAKAEREAIEAEMRGEVGVLWRTASLRARRSPSRHHTRIQ